MHGSIDRLIDWLIDWLRTVNWINWTIFSSTFLWFYTLCRHTSRPLCFVSGTEYLQISPAVPTYLPLQSEHPFVLTKLVCKFLKQTFHHPLRRRHPANPSHPRERTRPRTHREAVVSVARNAFAAQPRITIKRPRVKSPRRTSKRRRKNRRHHPRRRPLNARNPRKRSRNRRHHHHHQKASHRRRAPRSRRKPSRRRGRPVWNRTIDRMGRVRSSRRRRRLWSRRRRPWWQRSVAVQRPPKLRGLWPTPPLPYWSLKMSCPKRRIWSALKHRNKAVRNWFKLDVEAIGNLEGGRRLFWSGFLVGMFFLVSRLLKLTGRYFWIVFVFCLHGHTLCERVIEFLSPFSPEIETKQTAGGKDAGVKPDSNGKVWRFFPCLSRFSPIFTHLLS